MFERPIRVGDTVSIGNNDGTVVRIRIRATTIRNWDRKELLVPNKEFITGQLINWTLSDPTTRIVIPVGLAYGGDVELALKVMLKAAEEHPDVLSDPAPSVVFDAFGDNALSLNLRCFVADTDYRMPTITTLHKAINRQFNDAGLVIAFPQRDVHLDTNGLLDIRIRRDAQKSTKHLAAGKGLSQSQSCSRALQNAMTDPFRSPAWGLPIRPRRQKGISPKRRPKTMCCFGDEEGETGEAGDDEAA